MIWLWGYTTLSKVWVSVGQIVLLLRQGICCVLLLASVFPFPRFPASIHTPASQCLWLGELENIGAAGWRRWGCVTPWAQGHFRVGGVGWWFFCSMLLSLWASVLSGGLEAGGLEGGGLSAACERFVLWCNQYSLILFDFFFFSSFLLLLFFMFPPCRQFSPPTLPPLAPLSLVIKQKPETKNHSGCKGPLLGHQSPGCAILQPLFPGC